MIRTKARGGGRLELVRWVPRGHRWAWSDASGREVRFGGLGGAFSIDHRHRTPGRSWWPGIEEVEPQDVEALGPEPLDVLVSHDCPTGAVPPSTMRVEPGDAAQSEVSRALLRVALNATRPRLQFAGHWHQRRVYELDRQDGGRPTTVHVLNMDGEAGNFVVLDLVTLTVT